MEEAQNGSALAQYQEREMVSKKNWQPRERTEGWEIRNRLKIKMCQATKMSIVNISNLQMGNFFEKFTIFEVLDKVLAWLPSQSIL